MSNRTNFFLLFFLFVKILLNQRAQAGDYDEYDYGDSSVKYDAMQKGPYARKGRITLSTDEDPHKLEALQDASAEPTLPLCCPVGEVYDYVGCILAPHNFGWKPKLTQSADAKLAYSGFPKCETTREYIATYQKEVHFNVKKSTVFLPYYINLLAVPKDEYCIAKIHDPTSDEICELFQTKIFTCPTENKDSPRILWTSVFISHFLISITLLSFFLISELRSLQGQNMICLLISLLVYNLCLFPGSYFPMDISFVSCITLGSVKYFFFCGVFLWFNTICFDLWRTLKFKADLSGRRRFLLHAAYSFLLGAILTTVVLSLNYARETDGRQDPLMDSNFTSCKLKVPVHMILQISQFFALVIDFIFLIMASGYIYSYPRFGNGLPRGEVVLSLKQSWKLFIIMIAHCISCIDPQILKFPIPLWTYVLLESASIFGIFTYRKSFIKRFLSNRSIFRPKINGHANHAEELACVHEKGALTESS